MSATVTCLLEGGPPSSWKSLHREGSVSLNDQIPHLSHWSDHQSCNSLCVDPQSSPLCTSWGVVFLVICLSVNLIYVNPALKIGRMVMNMTYCDLWIDNLKIFYVWMICNVVDVVCHGEFDGYGLYRWNTVVMSCFCGGCIYPGAVIWSGLCRNHNDSSFDVFKSVTMIWVGFACLCLHSGVLNLIWHGDSCEICVELLEFLKEVSCVDNP